MLSLTDPRWLPFLANYTDGGRVARLLARPLPGESQLRYLLSALAAVHGYPALAVAIEGLDAVEE